MKTLCGFFLIFLILIFHAESKPKNVVIIMADDMGLNDPSYRGSNEFATYNIDALAYSGVFLDKFYTGPLCSPSRSSLMTGKYPHKIGMHHLVIANDEPYGLGLDQKIMPQYFKESNYSTHLIGKWHLGFHQRQYWPTNRGFDSFFGYFGGYLGYYNYSSRMAGKTYSWGYDLRKDLEVDRSYNNVYATDMFSQEAIKVIDKAANQVNPFFLLLTHLAPHAGLI
jgi:arylsulfatase B